MNPPKNIPLPVFYRAQRAGTFNKDDRTEQYDSAEYATPAELLKATNAHGNQLRKLQTDKDRLQRQLMNLKLRNSLIVSIVTGVVLALVEHFLR